MLRGLILWFDRTGLGQTDCDVYTHDDRIGPFRGADLTLNMDAVYSSPIWTYINQPRNGSWTCKASTKTAEIIGAFNCSAPHPLGDKCYLCKGLRQKTFIGIAAV